MEESEIRLVREARSGEREAYAALVERHWNRLVRLARSVVGEADSEDAVQEGFLIAWRKLSGLRHAEAFSGWLTRIVFRICLQKTRAASTVSVEEVSELSSNDDGVEIDIDVERILQKLAPQQRAVMHLTVVEGMTDSEIGSILNIRPSSVRAHRRRARESLSQRLRSERARWTRTVKTR
jgi:RNA polymerase sigma-70 factor (ECF subfamily)